MEIDIKNACRVCLQEGTMMSIFKVNISKKIMACASVTVWPNDGLPQLICTKCAAKLHSSFQFKRLCEKSDSKLREYLLKKDSSIDNKPEVKNIATNQLRSPPTMNSNIYIECVPISQTSTSASDIQTNFISLQHQHINFNGQNNLECSSDDNMLPVEEFTSVNCLMPAVQLGQMPPANTNSQTELTHPQMINNLGQMKLPDASDDIKIMPNDNFHKNTSSDRSDEFNNKLVECERKDAELRCKTCGKVLSTLSKLNKHMVVHNKDPAFKCGICAKTFSHSGNYKVHMRVHNDERPYKCSVCEHACRSLQDFEKHMRIHTGERPHACHHCPKAFAARSNLIAHIRTHTGERPYVCSVCEKAFCQSSELTKHMRTHTGEKSHVCDVCHKGFNGSSALTAHRRLHTGERPFTCEVCNKSFAVAQTLKVHMKLHDPDKGQSKAKQLAQNELTLQD